MFFLICKNFPESTFCHFSDHESCRQEMDPADVNRASAPFCGKKCQEVLMYCFSGKLISFGCSNILLSMFKELCEAEPFYFCSSLTHYRSFLGSNMNWKRDFHGLSFIEQRLTRMHHTVELHRGWNAILS